MNSYAEAESELSSGSRSFLNRMNDRLRKMLDRSPEDSMQDIDKRAMIWRMFMSSTLQASVFMVKNYSDNWLSVKNTEDLTMKQMFDISEKLITEQSDETYLGRLFMEVFIFGWWWRSHQSLAHKSLRILRFCTMLWKGEREPTIK